MSINWQVDKQNVIYPYSKRTIKKKVLIHAATWMNLKDIMLSGRMQKVTYHVIPFI